MTTEGLDLLHSDFVSSIDMELRKLESGDNFGSKSAYLMQDLEDT